METLGQHLIELRKAHHLSQAALAARIGVPQGAYNRWEAEAQPLPARYLPIIAQALDVDLGTLTELHRAGVRGPRKLPDFLLERRKRSIKLPPYPVQGTVDQMLNLGEVSVDLHYDATRRLSKGDLAHLDRRFPRDSEWELLAVFHLLALGGRPDRLTLARLSCPILVVEGGRSVSSGAYFLRDALVLEVEGFSVILFPQVWVVSVVQSEWYRLDFLCYVAVSATARCTAPSSGKIRAFGLPASTTRGPGCRRTP